MFVVVGFGVDRGYGIERVGGGWEDVVVVVGVDLDVIVGRNEKERGLGDVDLEVGYVGFGEKCDEIVFVFFGELRLSGKRLVLIYGVNRLYFYIDVGIVVVSVVRNLERRRDMEDFSLEVF